MKQWNLIACLPLFYSLNRTLQHTLDIWQRLEQVISRNQIDQQFLYLLILVQQDIRFHNQLEGTMFDFYPIRFLCNRNAGACVVCVVCSQSRRTNMKEERKGRTKINKFSVFIGLQSLYYCEIGTPKISLKTREKNKTRWRGEWRLWENTLLNERINKRIA